MQNSPLARKRWFWFALKLAVSLALLGWLFQKFEVSAESLKPRSYYPLIGALAAACATTIVGAIRWQVILRLYSQRLRFRETARIQYVAAFMNQFLPGFVGADAVRVYMAHRRGVRLAQAIASLMLDRAVALLGLILIVAATSPRILEVVKDEHLKQLLLWITAALCAGTAALVTLSGVLDRLTKRFRWLSPLAFLASGLGDLFCSLRALAAVLSASILMHAMFAVGLWASLVAFRVDVPFWDVLAIFAPIILFQMLPVSIGGWGVRELAAVTMLAAIGIAPAHALAASIILGIVQAISSLPGSVVWLIQVESARGAGSRHSAGG